MTSAGDLPIKKLMPGEVRSALMFYDLNRQGH